MKHLATFERMTDEELAAIGVFPPPPKPDPSVSKATNPAHSSPLDGTLLRPRRVTLGSSSTESGTPAKSLP